MKLHATRVQGYRSDNTDATDEALSRTRLCRVLGVALAELSNVPPRAGQSALPARAAQPIGARASGIHVTSRRSASYPKALFSHGKKRRDVYGTKECFLSVRGMCAYPPFFVYLPKVY